MATINPYLTFEGNTEEAFNFYRSVFGGEFVTLQRFKDSPESGKVQESEQNKIMHIALPIGNGNILMGNDVIESMGQKLQAGNNFYLSVSTASEGEAEKIFSAISTGGNVTMPLHNTFWGAFFGMCTDRFGIHWMISYDSKFQ